MRESEGGWLNRDFIGRHREREQVKTRLLQDGVLLLYGQPLVGKASLALQVAEELHEEYEERENRSLLVYTVDCKDCSDWPDVMQAMCRVLSLNEAAANENLLVGAILQVLRTSGCSKLMLLLLRLHGMRPTGNDVKNMTRCLRTLASSDVMTIMTSRRQLHLPAMQRVNPMTLDDAIELLRHEAPDVRTEEFRDVLQRYCYGLPPLVLQVTELVSGDPLLAFTASELQQELKDNPGLLMEGLEEEAQKLFSGLSPEVQDHVSCIVTLLDGSFSQEALQAVTGVEDARIKTLTRLMYDQSSVLIDIESRRMRIEPLVLHHIRKLGHMHSDDQARLRVVTLLGRVLTRAEHDLYVKGQDTVYGHLSGDWPQLQHVLRQAIHCTGNTYGAYFQVALKADKLLAKCFPNEALEFYRNMADAAVRFGTSRDLAIIQGMIGMAVTIGSGTGWEEALRYFHMALPVLQQDRNSLNYLRLLCDLGQANHRVNRLNEAQRYLQEAVCIGQSVFSEDEHELIFHLLRARSLLALPTIFRGHLSESKALLFETLELCEQFAPHHPDKPVMINSIGLCYERGDEDQDKALHYYNQSLVERRRYQDVAPGDLVVTLNNVGMQYSRRGDHPTALTYLAEAAAIRARVDKWHYHTALTHQHMGQVYLTMGEYKEAETHFVEASSVYARCTPHHDVRGKVAFCLAHLYVTDTLCDVTQAKRYLKEMFQLAEDKETEQSDSGLVILLSAIEHQVQLEGWNSNRVTSLLTWAQKLLDNFDGDPIPKMVKHKSIIQDIVAVIHNDDVTPTQTEALTSRIADQCQLCGNLGATQNVVSLWQRMEAKGQELRSVVSRLQGSFALRNVLDKIPPTQPQSSDSGVVSDLSTIRDSTQHYHTDDLKSRENLQAADGSRSPYALQQQQSDPLLQQKIQALQTQTQSLQLHQLQQQYYQPPHDKIGAGQLQLQPIQQQQQQRQLQPMQQHQQPSEQQLKHMQQQLQLLQQQQPQQQQQQQQQQRPQQQAVQTFLSPNSILDLHARGERQPNLAGQHQAPANNKLDDSSMPVRGHIFTDQAKALEQDHLKVLPHQRENTQQQLQPMQHQQQQLGETVGQDRLKTVAKDQAKALDQNRAENLVRDAETYADRLQAAILQAGVGSQVCYEQKQHNVLQSNPAPTPQNAQLREHQMTTGPGGFMHDQLKALREARPNQQAEQREVGSKFFADTLLAPQGRIHPDPDQSHRFHVSDFTDSNPPSLSSSDVSMTSMDSDVGRNRNELSTLCQRVVYQNPMQETARGDRELGRRQGEENLARADDVLNGANNAGALGVHRTFLPRQQGDSFVVHHPPPLSDVSAHGDRQREHRQNRPLFNQPPQEQRPFCDKVTAISAADTGPFHVSRVGDTPASFVVGELGPSQTPGDFSEQNPLRHCISSDQSVNFFDIMRAHRNSTENDVAGRTAGGNITQAMSLDLNAFRGAHELRNSTEQNNAQAEQSTRPQHSYTEASWPASLIAPDYTSVSTSSASLTSQQPSDVTSPLSVPAFSSLSGPPAIQAETSMLPHDVLCSALYHPQHRAPSNVTSQHGLDVTRLPTSHHGHDVTGLPTSHHGHDVTRQSTSHHCHGVTRLPTSHHSHDITRPPPTVESVLICAQQLMNVMRPGDPLTPEQRLTLAQIASWSSLTSSDGNPEGSSSRNRVFEDQVNKMAYLHEQQQQNHLPNQSQPPTHAVNQWKPSNYKPSQSNTLAQPALSGSADFQAIHQSETCGNGVNQSQRTLSASSQSENATASSLNQSERDTTCLNTAARKDQSLAFRKLSAGSGLDFELGEAAARLSHASNSFTCSSSETTERLTARREPTEDEEDTELTSRSFRQPTELEARSEHARSRTGSREAMENDERLDNPGHVCVSLHCQCSLRPR